MPATATPIEHLLRRPEGTPSEQSLPSGRQAFIVQIAIQHSKDQSAKIAMFGDYNSERLLKALIVLTRMK